MTIELMRDQLYKTAQLMTDLANELDVTGKKLTPEEEYLIRTAMLPFFKELINESLAAYVVNGDVEFFIKRLYDHMKKN
jgi:hypothetical protein